MSRAKPCKPPDHELEELVPGDAARIWETLRWLERVNRGVRDAAGALLAERQGREAPPSSRAVLEERACEQLLQLGDLLYEQRYRTVVAPHVAARLEPLVIGAVNACHVLADVVRGRPLGYEGAMFYLDALKVPAFELQKLGELLAAAFAEKTGRRKNGMTKREANQKGMDLVKEIGPTFWNLSGPLQDRYISVDAGEPSELHTSQ
jgi:hypothetical protein